MQIPFKKLSETAKTPTKAHWDDAGWDCYADEDVVIGAGRTIKIKTGIALAIPSGYCGVIFDRSSVGSKGIGKLAGVIDSQYRGEVLVCLHNHNEIGCEPHYIAKGYKIAQILVLPVPAVQFIETDELPESHRGTGGFGSSGKKLMVITSPYCTMYKHQIHVEYYEAITGEIWKAYTYRANNTNASFILLHEMKSFLYKIFKTTNYEIIDVEKL